MKIKTKNGIWKFSLKEMFKNSNIYYFFLSIKMILYSHFICKHTIYEYKLSFTETDNFYRLYVKCANCYKIILIKEISFETAELHNLHFKWYWDRISHNTVDKIKKL